MLFGSVGEIMNDKLDQFKVSDEFKNPVQSCTDCPLYVLPVNILTFVDQGKGKLTLTGQYKNDGTVKVLFIGIAPSSRIRFDKQRRAFFPGDLSESSSGAMFFNVLFDEKWDERYDLYVTNLVKCSTKDNAFPDDHNLNRCEKWLTKELRSIKPDFVICLSSKVFNEFTNRYVDDIIDMNIKVYYMKHPAYFYRMRSLNKYDLRDELRTVEKKLIK